MEEKHASINRIARGRRLVSAPRVLLMEHCFHIDLNLPTVGKLRSIFAENGRGIDWQPLMGIGNPAADRSVKQYLTNVREE